MWSSFFHNDGLIFFRIIELGEMFKALHVAHGETGKTVHVDMNVSLSIASSASYQ